MNRHDVDSSLVYCCRDQPMRFEHIVVIFQTTSFVCVTIYYVLILYRCPNELWSETLDKVCQR